MSKRKNYKGYDGKGLQALDKVGVKADPAQVYQCIYSIFDCP
jgi:hypothetical protein